MKVAKWGNSLAIRIPAPLALELGLTEGDDIQIVRNPDGAMAIASNDFDERRQRAIEWMRGSRRPERTHNWMQTEELLEACSRIESIGEDSDQASTSSALRLP